MNGYCDHTGQTTVLEEQGEEGVGVCRECGEGVVLATLWITTQAHYAA